MRTPLKTQLLPLESMKSSQDAKVFENMAQSWYLNSFAIPGERGYMWHM